MNRSIVVGISALALGLLSSATASAESIATGTTITSIRSHTSMHGIDTARSRTMVFVSGTLAGTCTKLWLPTVSGNSEDANSAAMSVLMAAYLSGKKVNIYYRPEQTAPWSDTSACAISAAEIVSN